MLILRLSKVSDLVRQGVSEKNSNLGDSIDILIHNLKILEHNSNGTEIVMTRTQF